MSVDLEDDARRYRVLKKLIDNSECVFQQVTILDGWGNFELNQVESEGLDEYLDKLKAWDRV